MNFTRSGQGALAFAAAVLCAAAVILTAGPANAKITLIEDIGDKQIKLQFFGWSQSGLRGGDGASEEGGPFFRAGFIRFGLDYVSGPVAGKLLLDFNQSHTNDEAGLVKMIKDAFVNYIFSSGGEDWVGLGGYQDDAWGVQWQYKF